MKTLHDNVIVRPIVERNVTKSGIIVAGQAGKPVKSVVVSAGPGRVFDNGTQADALVAVGDVVLHAPNTGVPLEHEDEVLLMLPETEIFAIID